jgi:hypothetical protein
MCPVFASLIYIISENNIMVEIMIGIAVHTRRCWKNLIFIYIQAASIVSASASFLAWIAFQP